MILEILLTLSIIYSVFISYLSMVAIRRINQYENFILKLQQIIEHATEKIKTVDSLGHYESDDETGFFFQQLKDLQELLSSMFEEEKNQQKRGDNNGKENKKEK